MIQRLAAGAAATPLYAKFVVELQRCGSEGDCSVGYGERLAHSTNNSIYQRLPQAVAFPKNGGRRSHWRW